MATQDKTQPVEIIEHTGGSALECKVLEIKVTGKLTQDDYSKFLPRIEAAIKEHGKVRLLVYLYDFRGWTMSALWDDLKFDWKHFNDIERLAIVGESTWQEGMALFCQPFTTAEIRYFDHADLPVARQWMNS